MSIETMNKTIERLTRHPEQLRGDLEDFCPYCMEEGVVSQMEIMKEKGLEWEYCEMCDHTTEPETAYTGTHHYE